MTLKPTPTIPSNYITDAAKANGDRYIYITSDGHSASSNIRLSDGTNLGLIQNVKWTLGVGDCARCVVETMASPAELVALMKNTTVEVRVEKHPLKTLWVYYTARARRWVNSLRS